MSVLGGLGRRGPAGTSAAVLVSLLLGLVLTAQPVAAGMRFTDATQAAGIEIRLVHGAPADDKGWLVEGLGSGAAWLDYDGDGDLDLYIVNGSTFDRGATRGEPNRLFANDGDGTFTDVTGKAGVGHRGWGLGATIGDYDGDGDSDIYVTNFGPNVLYRNDGDGTFSDVSAKAGVGDPRLGSSAAWFDADGDGHLDLYVGNYMVSDRDKVQRRGSQEAKAKGCVYKGVNVACGPLGQVPQQDVLYRNRGDGSFEDVTRKAGLWLPTPRYTLGVVAADYDNDGDVDLYAANDSVQNSLWRNDGQGKFSDVGLISLAGLSADGQAQAGMGTDFGDVNGDGWLDLVVTNFAHDTNTVYRNVGGKMFSDDTALLGLNVTYMALSWGTAFHDFDRDGDLDLFIANGHVYPEMEAHDIGTPFRQRNHLFRNDGNNKLAEVGASAGPGLALEQSFRGAAFADYDNDGDVDIFLTSLDGHGTLLRNDTADAGHWLTVELRGRGPQRDAVGAQVVVEAGGRPWLRQRKGGGSYLSGSDPRLHFGFGNVDSITKVSVRWPDGTRTQRTDVPIDALLMLEQPAKP